MSEQPPPGYREIASEAWLARANSWARTRQRAGAGAWSEFGRDLLEILQNTGDAFVAGTTKGTDLFSRPHYYPELDSLEAAAQERMLETEEQPELFGFSKFFAITSETVAPPPERQPSSLFGPGLGLGAALQTNPEAAPIVNAPGPVSSGTLTAANAPPFMQPNPLLQPSRPLPPPGAVLESNPKGEPDIPITIPPPPGGVIPPPPPPPLPGSKKATVAETKAKSARNIVSRFRTLVQRKRGDAGPVVPAPTTAPKSGFPAGIEASVVQALALRIQFYERGNPDAKLRAFQDELGKLDLAYSGLDSFQTHLDHVNTELQLLLKNSDYERFTEVVRLPFDGDASKLFPALAFELINTIQGIRQTIAEAETLYTGWQLPVSEQNFLDLARGFSTRLTVAGSTLVKLLEIGSQTQDSIVAPSAGPLPRLDSLEIMADVFRDRQLIPNEMKLWNIILSKELRVPGVDYARGLDHHVLRTWVNYKPLNTRFNTLADALVVAFPGPNAYVIRAFVKALHDRSIQLLSNLIDSVINQFRGINRTVVELFRRESEPVTGPSRTVAYCVQAANLQAQTFGRLSSGGEDLFKGEAKLYNNIGIIFSEAWKVYTALADDPYSIEAVGELLEHPDLLTLLPDDFGAKVEVRFFRPPSFVSHLLWLNACANCGIGASGVCHKCHDPFCEQCAAFSHLCSTREKFEMLFEGIMKDSCSVRIPPNVGQVVLDDQLIEVGPQHGQLLAFEYQCLQATQMHTNSNLFHLATITCLPDKRLSLRYIRVTVHTVIPLQKHDQLVILINGQPIREQVTFYGKPDGRAPQLRSRSLVIPGGAQVSWQRETDEAWLHGTVARIPLPTGPTTIRLALPKQLQPRGVFTKDVTASLEIVLTST